MAYCPIDEGQPCPQRRAGGESASAWATAAQVALGWLLRDPAVIVIPKAVKQEHLRENFRRRIASR